MREVGRLIGYRQRKGAREGGRGRRKEGRN